VIDFTRHAFHPVVVLPPDAAALDLTGGAARYPEGPWTIGRYDELRPGVYTADLFGGARCLHVGVDLGGPAGVAVHAFAAGRVLHAGYNPAPGDYGHALVTAHRLDGVALYALHGHLSTASVARWRPGDAFGRGDVLGWLGERHENGGWPPHVHFQLAWDDPGTHDMPGVVDPAERAAALRRYPDPRLVLGTLY